MHYLLYTSQALIPDTPAEHDAILQSCHRNNAAAGLTGFLVREGGHFIQYLEGPEAAIRATLNRIACDPRHTGLRVLCEGGLDAKRLPDWQMGFGDTAVVPLSEVLTLPAPGAPLEIDDPFDLIVFMVANSSALRELASAA